jgi:hypothetical protein
MSFTITDLLLLALQAGSLEVDAESRVAEAYSLSEVPDRALGRILE